MARNIEIKARITDAVEFETRVAKIADGVATEIYQDDTFFNCDRGRLKLRAFPDGEGDLIFYRREDISGPKASFYLISKTRNAAELTEVLSHAYGAAGRIQKRRLLYFVGRTRVHIDRVKNLGDFLELEVVLEENEDPETGIAEAEAILTKLGVSEDQLIEGAYVDLL